MENKQMETAYIKTKQIELFSTKIYESFKEVQDKVNEFVLLTTMETGKQPKIIYKDGYIAVEYVTAEEIEYKDDYTPSEEELNQAKAFYNSL